jgi:flavodoxin/ferredoxin
MKCVIIYFSQRGNTELIAKTIQKGIIRAAGNCDIVRIKEANPRRLYEYDLIGLGTPVMMFQEPLNVRAFINDMRFVGGKHVFPFSTHGVNPEYFFQSIVTKLRRKGLIVVGMYDCYAANLKNPKYLTAGHPDEIDLKEAEEFGREMVERSQRISAGETKLIPPLPKAPAPGSAYKYKKGRQEEEIKLGIPKIQATRQVKMKFNKEKCTYPNCQLCMENCPMDGIDLTVQPPVIGKPCMMCGFCAKICPTGALADDSMPSGQVSLDKEAMERMFKEHYLDPLAKAEAEGRFRRLLPLEDVVLRPPMDPNKHPQWIIGKGPP